MGGTLRASAADMTARKGESDNTMNQNTSYPRDAYQRERPGREDDDRPYPMGLASDTRMGSDQPMPADMRPSRGRDDYDQDPWRHEGGQTDFGQRGRNTQQVNPPRSAEGRRWDAPSRQGHRHDEYRAQNNRADWDSRGSDPRYYERQGFGGYEDQQQRDFGWEPMYEYQQQGRMGGVGRMSGAGNRQSATPQGQTNRNQATPQRERSYRGMGPRDYRRSDDRIREDVCDRLTDHSAIDPSDIDIKVSNGEVTLEGTVDSRRMKHLVEDIADDCAGVTDVHNRIKVAGRRSRSNERSSSSESSEDDEGNGSSRWNQKFSQDKTTRT